MVSTTVCVPTFNRRDYVTRLCSELASAAHDGVIALAVVDDGSQDGTFEALQQFAGANVNILRHHSNAGYGQALVSLLESVQTEFAILANDDSTVSVDALLRLQAWLGIQEVDLVATQFTTRVPTAPADFTAFRDLSSHAPGMVLRMSSALPAVQFLKDQLARGNAAAVVYPQSAIAAWVCAQGPARSGSAWWWSEVVVWEPEAAPSGIRDSTGLEYWAPKARVMQALGFVDLIGDLVDRLADDESKQRASDMLVRQLRTVYPAVRNAVMENGGAMAGAGLDRATLRQLVAVGLRRAHLRR